MVSGGISKYLPINVDDVYSYHNVIYSFFFDFFLFCDNVVDAE
jgi:hypothetical protein